MNYSYHYIGLPTRFQRPSILSLLNSSKSSISTKPQCRTFIKKIRFQNESDNVTKSKPIKYLEQKQISVFHRHNLNRFSPHQTVDLTRLLFWVFPFCWLFIVRIFRQQLSEALLSPFLFSFKADDSAVLMVEQYLHNIHSMLGFFPSSRSCHFSIRHGLRNRFIKTGESW